MLKEASWESHNIPREGKFVIGVRLDLAQSTSKPAFRNRLRATCLRVSSRKRIDPIPGDPSGWPFKRSVSAENFGLKGGFQDQKFEQDQLRRGAKPTGMEYAPPLFSRHLSEKGGQRGKLT